MAIYTLYINIKCHSCAHTVNQTSIWNPFAYIKNQSCTRVTCDYQLYNIPAQMYIPIYISRNV